MFDLSLNGAWELRREDDSGKVIPAVVPGCVQADLIRTGEIDDPFWSDQEKSLQWVGKAEWIYSRTFDVAPKTLAQDRILLRAEGLDTLAEVRLNGEVVGSADNQHITWEWDVKPLLREGSNRLEIRFAPPDAFLERQGKINPLPAWNEFLDYKHRGWLRKAHSNFGWDWAPVLVSCGIWRPISLIAFSGARLADVRTSQEHAADGSVKVGVQVEIETTRSGSTAAAVEIGFEGRIVARAEMSFAESATRGTASLRIPQPELWWPNGMGGQPLYTVSVRLSDAAGAGLDSWERRIGLRTLLLERRPDASGETFQFECNGVPFFVKGSNWVPPLPYSSWSEGDDWKALLRDAAAVHMNMMRMWGGAYFAPDEFFDLCDELGLTVWQDFLFACGPYPGFDESFLASVEKEARDNVRRMRHHPCIALWCGNNELEPTFVGAEWDGMKMSLEDYDRIFNGILPRVVRELAPEASYWPASPFHPQRDRTDPKWPFKPNAGDTHIWEIWFSDAPFENYRNYRNRFISEFGFQSLPHPKTIASFTLPEERQFNSPVMEHHQRSQPGNKQLLKFALEWFRFPDQHDDFVLLTQLVQALAVKTGVEHWRRNMPETMGVLYWQLNDCWPCPSWSSIDFFGRWKAIHFLAAHFFAPVLVSGLENKETGTVAVHLSNDLRREVRGVIRLLATDLDGSTLKQEAWPVTATAGTCLEVGVADLQSQIQQHGKEGVLVWIEFAEEDGNPATASRNLVLFDRPRRMELRASGLHCEVFPQGDESFLVTVTAKKPALWIWLDTTEFDTRFSDNGRCLRAGETWRVVATPARRMTSPEFTEALTVRDLRETYGA